ncbi:ATP-binding protein [Dethiosulfatarculus sandiegensis]|uniref:ATP-binding protein n=1 Tax=Dethiosulfatarculus sandiegensis TaxID=1429043 RepID=UPI0018D0D62C|nr:ATP-binding protein [Dethiosulfatarculus sandiegensis]
MEKLEGGRWIRTPHSWDRGRDFFRADCRTIAAEAKNRKAPLSISSLSPTLVMAVADNLGEVIFFSYSRINSNAIEHLSAFEEQTRIRIRVFHDDSLEDLILRYPTILREFFPTYNAGRRFAIGHVKVTTRISRDPEIHVAELGMSDALFEENTAGSDALTGFLNLLETFAMDFHVQNVSTVKKQTFKIRLSPETVLNHFELLDKEIEENDFQFELDLAPGQVRRRRVHLRPFSPGKDIDLTKWEPVEEKVRIKRRSFPHQITVTALVRSPLVGVVYVSALKAFEREISYRDKPVFRTTYGISGCGKTRMLYEYRNLLFRHGYRIIHIRGEFAQMTSFDEFMRRYLATRYGLPRQAPDEGDQTLNAPWRDKLDKRSQIDRLLYDKSWAPSQHMNECEDVFLRSLSDQQIGLVIDDVQGLDPTTLQFINNLTTKLLDSNHRFVLLLTFNLDLITLGSRANLYLQRLIDLSFTHSTSISSLELEGFSVGEAREFINNCLRSKQTDPDSFFTIIYKEITQILLSKIELTPLFLEQTLLYLDHKKAIKHDALGYYVHNYKTLKREVNQLETGPKGKRLEILLSHRYNALEKTLSEDEWVIIELLCRLRQIPRLAFNDLRINLLDIIHLIELGIIVDIAGYAVEFRHQTLLRLISSRRKLSDQAIIRLDQFFLVARWREVYFAQYMLRVMESGMLSRKLASKLLDRLRKGQIDNEDLLPLTDALLLELNQLIQWFDPSAVIRVLDDIAYCLRPLLGFDHAAKLYAAIYRRLVTFQDDIRQAGSEFFMLCARYGSLVLAMRQDQKAMGILRSSLDMIKSFEFSNSKMRDESIGLVANRLCAALLGHRRKDAAKKMSRKVMRAAHRGGFKYIEFQQHIDNGYIHYGFRSDNAKLIYHWKTAVTLFDEAILPEHELITNRAVAKLHEAHVDILEGKLKSALSLIKRERWICKEQLDPFHESKLVLLGAVVFLLGGRRIMPVENAIELVSYAKDLASRFDLGQVYWIAFHTNAKIWQMNHEKERAAGELNRAFAELTSVVDNAEMEDRFDWFFEDYAISMRELDARVDSDRIILVKRKSRQNTMHSILEMTSKEFNNYYANYTPKTTYYRDKYNLPCP